MPAKKQPTRRALIPIGVLTVAVLALRVADGSDTSFLIGTALLILGWTLTAAYFKRRRS